MYKPKFMNLEIKEKEVEIRIDGDIVDELTAEMYDWFGDQHAPSPSGFRQILKDNEGKEIKVSINSYGGDVFAAAAIYTALSNYRENTTVYIESIAASAASVIAMAGKKVVMSPVASLMIHNPSTYASGDHTEMEATLNALTTIKETIITAYENKTNLPRDEISKLMDEESWFDAYKAKELGFIDEIDMSSVKASVTNDCMARNKIIYNQVKKPMFAKVNNEEEEEPEGETEEEKKKREEEEKKKQEESDNADTVANFMFASVV